jgi:hypothetical protein
MKIIIITIILITFIGCGSKNYQSENVPISQDSTNNQPVSSDDCFMTNHKDLIYSDIPKLISKRNHLKNISNFQRGLLVGKIVLNWPDSLLSHFLENDLFNKIIYKGYTLDDIMECK